MSIEKQVFFPGVVEVAKGAIDSELRPEIAVGIEVIWSQYENLAEQGREIGHLVLPHSVLEHTPDFNMALRKIIKITEVPTNARIAITSYERNAMTNFHVDYRSHAVIIYPKGTGWLDVSPHALNEMQAERAPLSVQANVGDVAFANTSRFHRGRNSDEAPRKTVAFLFD